MRMLNLFPAEPERPNHLAATMAPANRRKTLKSFALIALLSLSALALNPMASMASERPASKKTATTIKLKVSATTVKAGQTLTLTADVTPTKATGTVTAYGAFKSSGPWEVIKSESLHNGVAKGSEMIPSGFDATVQIWLKAVYKGSSTYATSTSNVVKVTIEK